MKPSLEKVAACMIDKHGACSSCSAAKTLLHGCLVTTMLLSCCSQR